MRLRISHGIIFLVGHCRFYFDKFLQDSCCYFYACKETTVWFEICQIYSGFTLINYALNLSGSVVNESSSLTVLIIKKGVAFFER